MLAVRLDQHVAPKVETPPGTCGPDSPGVAPVCRCDVGRVCHRRTGLTLSLLLRRHLRDRRGHSVTTGCSPRAISRCSFHNSGCSEANGRDDSSRVGSLTRSGPGRGDGSGAGGGGGVLSLTLPRRKRRFLLMGVGSLFSLFLLTAGLPAAAPAPPRPPAGINADSRRTREYRLPAKQRCEVPT